jgi:hypothetical protein
MAVTKPRTPVATALVKIPLPATTLHVDQRRVVYGKVPTRLALFVSSAMWPEASKPVIFPAVKRLDRDQPAIPTHEQPSLQGENPVPRRWS